MVGAGHVVSQGLGAPGAHEDGAGVADLAQEAHGVLAVQLQVLGGHHVDGLGGRVKRLGHHDDAAVVQARAGDVLARGLGHQALGGRKDAVGQRGVAGHQVAAGKRVVLGLSHEVGCHHHGVGRGVGQHADLRGAGHHVDAHVARDVALGGRHVGVAGADNLVARGDGLGAVGHGADGLGAADGVDLVDAGQGRGGQGVGREGPVTLGRGHHDHARHAGHLGGNGVHEHGGGVLGAAAGHVDGGGGHRRHLDAQQRPVRARGEPGLLALLLVEGQDLVAGAGEGLQKLRVHHGGRGLDQLVRHAEALGAGAVEARAVLAHRGVPAVAHVAHDVLGGVHDLARQCPGAVEVGLSEGAAAGEFYLPHCYASLVVALTSARRAARSRILLSQR